MQNSAKRRRGFQYKILSGGSATTQNEISTFATGVSYCNLPLCNWIEMLRVQKCTQLRRRWIRAREGMLKQTEVREACRTSPDDCKQRVPGPWWWYWCHCRMQKYTGTQNLHLWNWSLQQFQIHPTGDGNHACCHSGCRLLCQQNVSLTQDRKTKIKRPRTSN